MPDETAHKSYYASTKRREKPEDLIVDYRFSHDPAMAATFETEDLAEADRIFLSKQPITVELQDGSKYPCGDFKVETRSATEYILYCELPFPIGSVKQFIR
jgi:hypothetical protein